MDFQLTLTADDGVEGAGDCFVVKEGALQAAFIAADAGTNVFRTALFCLFGPFGICPQRTAQHDEVAFAAGEDVFCVFRQRDGAGGHDGDRQFFLQCFCCPYIVADFNGHGADLMNHGVVVAAGDVDGVNTACFQTLGQINGIFNAESVGLVVGAAQTNGDGEVGADLFADILNDLKIDAAAVFQSAAVHISAVVRGGGEEIGEQITVGTVDLHQFKTGDLGTQCGIAEAFYDFVNFGNGQFLRHSLQTMLCIELGPRNGRRCLDRLCAEEFLSAAVLDLNCRNSTHFTDIFCQPGQARNMFIVGNAQMAMGGFGADIIYISIFHNNHTCAAGSLVTVIADGALGNRAVLVVHTGGLGRFADAVLDFEIADFARGEKMGEHVCHTEKPPCFLTHCGLQKPSSISTICYSLIFNNSR